MPRSSARPGAGRPIRPPAYTGPSPFSSLLAEYMWNSRDSRNRPLGVGQLAIKLGISRATLNTWVHRNAMPDVDTTLQVLCKLNIPVSRLFDHYTAIGLPVPPLTADEANANANANANATAGASGTQITSSTRGTPPAVPPSQHPQRADQQPLAPATPATSATPATLTPPATSPAPPAPTMPAAPSPTPSPDPWEATITVTADALRQLGIPEAAIAATIANIRATQTGQPHPLQHHVAAEHADSAPPEREDQPHPQQQSPPRSPHPQRR